MVSPESTTTTTTTATTTTTTTTSKSNCNLLYDYGCEDNSVPCPLQSLNDPPDLGINIGDSTGEPEGVKENRLKKRERTESCTSSSSKAVREKNRRDKLNDKFMELGALIEPEKPLKTDKAAILADASRMVSQLRSEAQKLKDSNSSLHDKIKELKEEKNELRDEKQRLRVEKENLEQQLKIMNPHPGFMRPAMSSAFAAQGQYTGNKLVPVISYPGVAMWQFLPPAAVDTSKDHMLFNPVA